MRGGGGGERAGDGDGGDDGGGGDGGGETEGVSGSGRNEGGGKRVNGSGGSGGRRERRCSGTSGDGASRHVEQQHVERWCIWRWRARCRCFGRWRPGRRLVELRRVWQRRGCGGGGGWRRRWRRNVDAAECAGSGSWRRGLVRVRMVSVQVKPLDEERPDAVVDEHHRGDPGSTYDESRRVHREWEYA